MTAEQDLLALVIAHPSADEPKLILADWYDEHGRPQMARRWRWAASRVPGCWERKEWLRPVYYYWVAKCPFPADGERARVNESDYEQPPFRNDCGYARQALQEGLTRCWLPWTVFRRVSCSSQCHPTRGVGAVYHRTANACQLALIEAIDQLSRRKL